MSYFGYVGRLLSNVKGFYNEINSATLTGAIDVVIVQQEDGSFLCSPFHVRFGKLGVLRSREKVVDIEINGAPVDLHMKLGEAGEAFFVKEIQEDAAEIPPYLATSPIPSSEDLMEAGVRELHKQVALEEQGRITEEPDKILEDPGEEDISPLSDGFETNELYNDSHTCDDSKVIATVKTKPDTSGFEVKNSAEQKNDSDKIIADSEQKRDTKVTNVPKLEPKKDKTKTELFVPESKHSVTKTNKQVSSLSISNRSGKKHSQTKSKEPLQDSDNSSKESGSREVAAVLAADKSLTEDSSKTKRRKKKKTNHKKSNPRAASKSDVGNKMTKSDNTEAIFDLEVTTDEEDSNQPPVLPAIVKSVSLPLAEEDRMDRTNVWANSQFEAHLHPFSDTDVTPIGSPSGTRCTSPSCKSDTECEKQRQEDTDTDNLMPASDTVWEWGQLPKSVPASQPENMSGTSTKPATSHEKDSNAKSSSGLFYFMRKTKAIRHKPEEEGIYLADLTKEEMDPEIAKLYFPKSSTHFMSIRDKEEDAESGRGASLPQSPHSVEGAIGGPPASYLMSEVRHLGEVSLSLCGGLADVDGNVSMESFMQSVVTFDTMCEDLSLVQHPDLVVRIGDKFYNWATAAPQILSLVTFQRYLPEKAIQGLVKEHMPKKKDKKAGYSWFSWRRAPPDATQTASPDTVPKTSTTVPATTTTVATVTSDNMATSTTDTVINMTVSAGHMTATSVAEETVTKTSVSVSALDSASPKIETDVCVTTVGSTNTTTTTNTTTAAGSPVTLPNTVTATVTIATVSKSIDPDTKEESVQGQKVIEKLEVEVPMTGILESPCSSAPSSPKKSPNHQSINRLKEEDSSENETDSSERSPAEGQSISSESADLPPKKYKKSLRLSSQQIMKLNLREGQNEITFSVTTQYQGTTRCTSHIYLWRYDDKIVISDIDGTITKSDVLGQILPILGRDWSQSGVAELYTKINNNGYKFVYLSARAIGQSKVTKDLLRKIRQDDLVLPEGPLMLSPISLISAFHREVIEKKPEEFKIRCMSDIGQLFPQNQRPFYAGFGNKINDVYAYKAVDIPFSRIFTINPRGELRHEKILTFQSSYQKLVDVVDHFFPPIQRRLYGNTLLHSELVIPNEFRSMSFWKEPLPEISLECIMKVKGQEVKDIEAEKK